MKTMPDGLCSNCFCEVEDALGYDGVPDYCPKCRRELSSRVHELSSSKTSKARIDED